MTSPFTAKMTLPDPHMEPALSTLLCSTLNLCPGHMRAYSSKGLRTIDDLANSTMSTLHQLSLKTTHIDDFFESRSRFNTGEFFSDLLLLIQWSIYHRQPISNFTPAILEELQENGTDSELRLHFEKLLNYSSEFQTDTVPTIRELHPNLFSTKTSSNLNSTNSSTPSNTTSSNKYSSDDDEFPTLHHSTTTPPPLPTFPSVTSTINKIADPPTQCPSNDDLPDPTATAFWNGFDTGVEAAHDDSDNSNVQNDDHEYCDHGYDGGYDDDNYDDGGYDNYDDYEPYIDPEPPPYW